MITEKKKNRDYAKEVLKILKEKDPYLYQNITKSQVLKVINYLTKNICYSMLKGVDIRVDNFMSIWFDKKREYSSRLRKAKKKRSNTRK